MRPNLRTLFACLLLIGAKQATATPNIRLTTDAGSSIRPRLALDPSNNVIVVWQDDRFGNNEILWQKFDQLGSPLTPVVRVTNTSASSVRPDIACDAAGASHIVWQEGENVNGVGTVYLCRLDASGAKVFGDLLIKDFSGDARVTCPSTGVSDLFWARYTATDQDVYYRRYNSSGTQTCQKQFNAGTIPAISKTPAICSATNGDAQLFWIDMTTSFQLHLRQGATLNSCASGQAVAWTGNAHSPSTDNSGTNGIYTVFEAGGDIYDFLGAPNACKLSQGAGSSNQPAVAADANQGYAVWRDTRNGNTEIYFCRYSGCPSTTGDLRLTADAAVSETPDITVEKSGSGRWVAVWSDGRDGNREIYLASQALADTPTAPGNLSAALLCPPAASLTWQDLATNETSYEVQSAQDGGAWGTAASLAANTTAWASGALAYGHSFAYRVRACNGALCSNWAGPVSLTVAEQVLLREGVVRATVLERPYADPVLRPIPSAKVSILRNGAPIYSTYSDPGTGAYQIVASMRCDDEIAVSLEDDFRHFHMVDWNAHQVNACGQATAPIMQQPIDTASTIDFTWPIVGQGYSGDPVNIFYVYSRAVADYWGPQIGVVDADWLDFFCRANVPIVSDGMGVYPLGQMGKSCGSFQAGYGKYKSGILHEFGHRMINQKVAGPGIRENFVPAQHPEAAEAAALDEGLADYFAAATDEDPIIYTRMFRFAGVEFAEVVRDLSQLKLYLWCNGAYGTQDEHFGGWALGGALWDLRGRLAAIPGFNRFDLDRTVYATIATLKDLSVEQRTLRRFRENLLATQLGQDHLADFQWAFDRHNIKPSPNDACRTSPEVASVTSTVQPDGRTTSVSWTAIAEAAYYRLFVERFAPSGTGLGPGELLADSLTATTFTYTEPDTTLTLAFRVSAVDASGDEGPAGAERPAVTGVGPRGDDGPAHLAIRVAPNPALRSVTIHLSGGQTEPISIDVFDVAGRCVRTLCRPERAQSGAVMWDCRATDGRAVPGGIYLIRARATHAQAWEKVVILR